MLKLLAVGLGGFIGAIARYGLSGLVHRYDFGGFPAGTLAVNVLGCLVIGAVSFLVDQRQFFSPEIRLFISIGLLGSFTTFSTVAFETVEMLRAREMLIAGVNIAANVLIGLVAVWLGRVAMRSLGV